MKRINLGRSALIGIVGILGLSGCAPTPTWDPQQQKYVIENQIDDTKVAAGASRLLIGGLVGNAIASGIESAGERQRIEGIIAENNRLLAENKALRIRHSVSGEGVDSSRIYLSDQELLSVVENDPCFFVQYVGNDSEGPHLVKDKNPLEDFVGKVEILRVDGRRKVKGISRGELLCDQKVLVYEFEGTSPFEGLAGTNDPGVLMMGALTKIERRGKGYLTWDADSEKYKSISFMTSRFANKREPFMKTVTSSLFSYDPGQKTFICESISTDNSGKLAYRTTGSVDADKLSFSSQPH